MLTILAYVLVIPLVQFCLTAGVGFVGILAALLLAWTPNAFRTKVAGFCGGFGGIAFAVAFGFGIFHFLIGPDSFTIGAFLASTIPLLIPIRNDFLQWRRANEARESMLQTVAVSRGESAAKQLATETKIGHVSCVVGEIFGLVLAAGWFFWR